MTRSDRKICPVCGESEIFCADYAAVLATDLKIAYAQLKTAIYRIQELEAEASRWGCGRKQGIIIGERT